MVSGAATASPGLTRRELYWRTITDNSSPVPVASSSAPPTLPPSVEAAYKIKCIALKKRLIEIEAQNDATRERVVRTERGIRKLRLERAILLTRLSEIISKNGEDVDGVGNMYDGNSEGSSEGPPTQPHEKPLRTKRSHRRQPLVSPPPTHAPSSSIHPTPRGSHHHHRQHPYESAYSAHEAPQPYHRTQHRPSSSGLTNGHPSSSHYPSISHHHQYQYHQHQHHQPQFTNPHDPPLDAFTTFLYHSIRQNQDFIGLSEDEQLNKARQSWHALPPTEHERMARDYQQRLLEWEAALEAAREREEEQAGRKGGAREGLAGEGEGEPEAEDEEMEDMGKGGFTAVNG
ncbi:MAG: hypothetical protein Q9208_008348 [Pyrenodesmia sp. 3 TL-2023]